MPRAYTENELDWQTVSALGETFGPSPLTPLPHAGEGLHEVLGLRSTFRIGQFYSPD